MLVDTKYLDGCLYKSTKKNDHTTNSRTIYHIGESTKYLVLVDYLEGRNGPYKYRAVEVTRKIKEDGTVKTVKLK